jgi:hypothetical protein
MDSLKFEAVKYYYCNSYTLDTIGVNNFNIDFFNIKPYERYRSDDEFITIEEKEGLIITLIPKNQLIYKP